MITNLPAPDHLDKLLYHLRCFFKAQRKLEASSSQTQCPVFKRLQRHIDEWILTVLLVLTKSTLKYVCKPWGPGCWLCLSNFLPSFVLMRTKLMYKLNRNLTEEENFSQCLKILTQITIEDENELAEREVFPKTINERILRQWQQTYLEKLLCILQCFLHKDKQRKDGNDF